MTFKRPLSVPPTPPKTNNNQSLSQSNTCKVCGNEAQTKHYGAIACHPCKTFFRRNGFRPELVRPCQYDGQCEMTLFRRKLCTSCRLEKCFSVGMSSDLIRKEDLSKTKSEVIRRNKIMSVFQSPMLNLRRNTQSSLSAFEWRLFSNVLHAFDRFNIIPKINNILQNLSLSPYEIRFDVTDAMETVGLMYTSIQSLVTCTPDFQVLGANEQRSLIERNLHGVGSIYFQLVFRETGLFENLICFQSYSKIYGLDITKQANCLLKRLHFDSTLVKLMLIIITFSSNCFIVNAHENRHKDGFASGTFRLFGSQNVYVELLWKYMIYQYGYCDAVLHFNALIKYVLDVIRYTSNIYSSNEIHHDFVDDIVVQTNQKLIISQNEFVPLWGKDIII